MNNIHVICKRQKEDAISLAARIIQLYGHKIDVFVDELSEVQMYYKNYL
jgi:hypothetical protein